MKTFFRKYVAYLKDNPEGYWFKARLFGWGWTPATREGWFVTLGAIAFITANAFRFERGGYPESEVFMQVIVPTVVVIILLVIICFKTGEKPYWNWSFPKEEEDAEDSQIK